MTNAIEPLKYDPEGLQSRAYSSLVISFLLLGSLHVAFPNDSLGTTAANGLSETSRYPLGNSFAATYYGGSRDESVQGVAVDSRGRVIVAAWSSSCAVAEDPIQRQQIDPTGDVIIVRFTSDLTRVDGSMRLPGSLDDKPTAVVTTPDDRIVLTGYTRSPDFPITDRPKPAGLDGHNAFLVVLDAAMENVEYATVFGGSGNEIAFDVEVDALGVAYVAGSTASTDFVTTPGVHDRTPNGNGDAFVSAFDLTTRRMVWSTVVGGREADDYWDLALAPDERTLWAVGRSYSVDYPVSSGAWDRTWNGSFDIVLTQLETRNARMIESTFFGGIRRDEGKAIHISPQGDILVSGVARSPGFPTTPGAFDRTLNGHYDAFVARFDSYGRLQASTLLGGETTDQAHTVHRTSDGRVIVTGLTWSQSFPTTPGAWDTDFNGVIDGFFSTFDDDLSELRESSMIGGDRDDIVYAAALDPLSNFLFGGYSRGSFPVTEGAFDETANGGMDAVVVRVGRIGD